MGIRDVPDGKSRTVYNTGLWDEIIGQYRPIAEFIDEIDACPCGHSDDDVSCEKSATHLCLCFDGIFPACSDHGKLDMDECFGMVKAIIDKDGLRMNEESEIYNVLSDSCDHCHSFEHMTESRPHLSNNCKAICNICYDKEIAKTIAENKAKTRDKVFAFLDVLRESGVTNMFGARPYIMEHFPDEFTESEAGEILVDWMKSK